MAEPLRTCPACGGEFGDEDAFCEIDGAALVSSSAPSSGGGNDDVVSGPLSDPISGDPLSGDPVSGEQTTKMVAKICAACGAIGSDDGDGYCAMCGHKLTRPSVAPSIPPKTAVGVWSVGNARGADDFDAQDASGRSVALAVGDASALDAGARALESLKGDPAMPHVIERGSDGKWGAYLALSAMPKNARALADAAKTMTIAESFGVVRAALDLGERIEKAALDWLPLRDDFYWSDDGALLLARLRGAHPLSAKERLDGRAITEAVGGAFLPSPAVHGTTRLVRFFSAHTLIEGDRLCTIEYERDELAAITAEGPPKDDATQSAAVVCDPGMKRGYNEDAGAVATGESNGEPWAVLVVCDGVSSSTHAEKASAIASKTACDTLAHFARSGDITHEASSHAVATAVRAAHIAICAQRFDHGIHEPPGTTIVVALVFRRRITVGWVGDSRAYWLIDGGGELLTRDHSWVNETVARGEMSEEEAQRQPLAHALTRCLGPLEVGDGLELVEPDVRTRDLPGPGLVMLCSDGMWNYFQTAPDLARLVSGGGATLPPAGIARLLLNHALERGGHDNVTVAVYRHS